MESLWSGQGLLRERLCCTRGWWMMAGPVLTGLSQEIHGTSFSHCLSTPNHGHNLVTYPYINTTIQPTTEFVGSTIKNQPGDYPTHPLTSTQLYNHTTEFVGSTIKDQPGDYPTHPLRYKLPYLHRMLLFGE